MVNLVTLNPDADLSEADFRLPRRLRMIRTYAKDIVPSENGNDPCPDLDAGLRNLICLCWAANMGNIPSISGLTGTVIEAIEKRDEDWYGGDPIEEDDTIRDLLKKLLLDADR